ncbi:DUF5641 domain-containing protein [Trichonephila clavipes]|nr:DUF5641 domain-containing protein [Trichonephila clavipes]
MKNAVSGRTKTDLSALYDELEGKLRSLESLGRTQEKYGDFLTPLVESCLPEEILMAWERKRNTETDAKGSRSLEHLMTFLRLEVQGEEMVQLAKSGFGTPIRKKDSPTERVKPTELMTASALASSVKFSETEIGLLIGADNIGKLLTGNLIEFDSGLTAIETKLGWTVIGKVCSNDKNVMLTTSSLHVRNVRFKELWELDVLGITDPLLNENTKENFELTDFKNKMKILPDGRYEVNLPWKCNSENLPSNKELTWKRHLRMMNKLRNGKFFEDYKSVFRQWEELSTVICDCEFLINSRPLTYISENPQELIPLTPAMFLIENRCSDTTDIDELNSRDLRKRMKYRIKLLSDLRQRFRKEYLSELIQKQNDNRVREPRIGEMVLIGNDKKRLSWPIAKIIELIPGRDGEIRTVRLKTQHGTVIRPVQRIFPLEVQAIANSDKELKEESVSVKSTKPEKVLNTNDAIIKKYTSSGRLVKEPKRDLIFEL